MAWLEAERGGVELSPPVGAGMGVETGEGGGVPSEAAQAALSKSRASGMMLMIPP